MNNKRQAFSATVFNDKYIFVFGGRSLEKSSLPFGEKSSTYINDIEVYDVEKNTWKVLNYIADKQKLNILYPGAIQVSG